MDNLILEGILRILSRDLTGKSLLEAGRVGKWEYLLRFSTYPAARLLIRLRPPHPVLHRIDSASSPPWLPPDPFAVLLVREIEGARLDRIGRPGLDRVVETTWTAPSGEARILVAELLGKSGNLLLLDSRRRILGYAREMASAFRAPAEGALYRPPVQPEGMEGVTLEPRRAGEYLNRFAGGGSPLAAATSFLRGLSPPLAEDFSHRPEAVEDPEGALSAILAESAEGRFQPCLYTSLDPEEMLRQPSAGAAPILSPFPLRRRPLTSEKRLADPEDASRLWTLLQDRLRADRDARGRIAAALSRESKKLRSLSERLEKDLSEAGHAESLQRDGDLILAQPAARVIGGSIVVKDLYDPEGRERTIPADPALSPRENAERLYVRARKLRRGAETIRDRLEGIRSRLRRSESWGAELASARTDEDLRHLEAALAEARVLAPAKPAALPRARLAPEGDAGIRKFRTSDGFLILVGKSASDNDRLTFQMASPHDFWLHTADRSGAHVVVRNPGKLKELPAAALLAAAQIAAHFSRARGKGRVEVHCTLRKYVRKGRGLPAGMVVLRNHRTLHVEPAIPGGEGR
jgi:predicted ribosome quality control (RQC) complex YloA/Tae2 family protein